MLSNTNYSAKLSPSIKENWLVQVFKNDATSILTNSTPNTIDKNNADYNLRFCFASASGSTKATYNGHDYYPAILNQPTITNSLDLKSFTTNTGSITLNIANIDLAETTLLEILGNEFINGHVNILSQIDDDDTADNALQIFSGKVSSFGYRNNTIIFNIISNRPFQNVSLPQAKTTGDFSGVDIPYILGSYNQSSSSVFSKELYNLYKVPYVRNDNDNMVFLMPNKIADNTTSLANLEFYDKNVQRFIPLNKAGFSSTTTSELLDTSNSSGGTTVKVNSQLVKDFNIIPNDLTDISGNTLTVSATSGITNPTFSNGANAFDLSADGTENTTSFATLSGGVDIDNDETPPQNESLSLFLKFPKPMHKLTNFVLTITYDLTITNSNGFSGVRFYMHSDGAGVPADETNAAFIAGTSSTFQTTNVSKTTTSLVIDQTQFDDIFKDGLIQDDLRLTLKLYPDEQSQGIWDAFECSVKIYSIRATYTTTLTTSDEPIAKQESNANTDFLYIGQGITTSDFNGHSGVNNDLNNPVSIHRQIIKDFAGINSGSGDSENLNNGYKGVAELRDSNTASSTSHWKTRLALYETESLEQIMKKLQYEGCFFFQYSPQAQQTSISGATSLRYFTIPDNPTASVDLSQNDISDYEIGITPAQDLETNIVVNYNKHPEENKYEFNEEYLSTNHNTIFGDSTVQKQDINLDLLYDAVAVSGTARNTSWINFRKKLFGDYKTTVSTTLINPEKYALLEIGDFIDFGEILFSELGSPFNEISDTFDSFVAMPTRLFSEAWSGKKFMITNIKRKIGQVSVQCREV